MSNQVSLKATRRTAMGRNAVKKVKAAQAVPAILYGSGVEPTPLQLERRAIDTLLAHAVGENILVNLEIEDGGKSGGRLALINEVQHHPVKRSASKPAAASSSRACARLRSSVCRRICRKRSASMSAISNWAPHCTSATCPLCPA
jgi:ribosomal protein L25 (general stress protein Ctc)